MISSFSEMSCKSHFKGICRKNFMWYESSDVKYFYELDDELCTQCGNKI